MHRQAAVCTHRQMPTWSKTLPAVANIVAGLMVATGARFAGPIPIPIPARTTMATMGLSTMALAVSIITTVASRYVGPVPIETLLIKTAKALRLTIARAVIFPADAVHVSAGHAWRDTLSPLSALIATLSANAVSLA